MLLVIRFYGDDAIPRRPKEYAKEIGTDCLGGTCSLLDDNRYKKFGRLAGGDAHKPFEVKVVLATRWQRCDSNLSALLLFSLLAGTRSQLILGS
jgi:hypothetical protein